MQSGWPPPAFLGCEHKSSGLTVIVAKAIAHEMEGLTVDAKDGQYSFDMPQRN
jgi:hypothetical protein